MQQRVNFAEAIAAVAAGNTMSSVARQYGVSRERIRQIVRRANVVPPSGLDNRRVLRDRVSELALDGLKDAAIAGQLGLTIAGVAADRRKAGLSEAGWRETRIDLLRSGIEAGQSIRQIALKLAIHPTTLQAFAKSHGVVSLHGRHRDLSFRRPLLHQWRAAGHTWEEIDELLSAHEGRPNYRGAAYLWARKHSPDAIGLAASSHAAGRP